MLGCRSWGARSERRLVEVEGVKRERSELAEERGGTSSFG